MLPGLAAVGFDCVLLFVIHAQRQSNWNDLLNLALLQTLQWTGIGSVWYSHLAQFILRAWRDIMKPIASISLTQLPMRYTHSFLKMTKNPEFATQQGSIECGKWWNQLKKKKQQIRRKIKAGAFIFHPFHLFSLFAFILKRCFLI